MDIAYAVFAERSINVDSTSMFDLKEKLLFERKVGSSELIIIFLLLLVNTLKFDDIGDGIYSFVSALLFVFSVVVYILGLPRP